MSTAAPRHGGMGEILANNCREATRLQLWMFSFCGDHGHGPLHIELEHLQGAYARNALIYMFSANAPPCWSVMPLLSVPKVTDTWIRRCPQLWTSESALKSSPNTPSEYREPVAQSIRAS